MTASRFTICLVTPSHPANNPRLVKEAEALVTAGYTVHVVTGRYIPALDGFDDAIYRQARWKFTCVDYTSGPGVFGAKLLRRLIRKGFALGLKPSLTTAAWANHIAIPRLAEVAALQRADLYIGHCLAGLAAAGLAAERTGAKLGFDAEDFHSRETAEVEVDPVDIASIFAIENHWLPRCGHLTAASPLIAAAYRDRYGIREPLTVLNVFPLSEAPTAPLVSEAIEGPFSLYWFSQTIGPDRGLEALVGVLGRMRSPCNLRLRGLPSNGFPDILRALARSAGFRGSLEFAPLAHAQDMISLTAGAHLGLSLENSTPLNRDLCLTNKTFTYLLAGVPVALTPTSAQRELARKLGPAALLLDLKHPTEAAAVLDAWLADPIRRAEARSAAWRLGRERYHWEHEVPALLDSVAAALAN